MNLSQATSQTARAGRALFPSAWFRRLPLCIYLCLLPVTTLWANSITLSSDTQQSSAGYFQLQWAWPDAPQDVQYTLQERQRDAQFKTIYQGGDQASVISGKPNGRYEYKVLASTHALADSMPSNTIQVEVKHHSLRNALILFALGLFIFLSILFVILRNLRTTR